MNVVGLMPWFDEEPGWLFNAVSSAGRLCDHVVAVDGSYALFPEPSASSPRAQHEAIRDAAALMGISCTIHTPSEPWRGNEVHKRNQMINLGFGCVESDEDWFYCFDADTVVAEVSAFSVRGELERTDLHVASVTLFENAASGHGPVSETQGHRMLYRANPDLRVLGMHWCYVIGPDDDPTVLWGPNGFGRPADVLRLDDFMRVEHRSNQRDPVRNRRARAYYQLRDTLQVERLSEPVVEAPDGELRPVGWAR